MISNLNDTQIDQFLRSQFYGRLGVYANEKVYVVPFTYAYDGTYFYGQTVEGQKIHMMRQNPKVCVEVDRVEQSNLWQSVIAHGTFEELSGREADEIQREILTRLRPYGYTETLRPTYSMQKPHQESMKVIVFRIKIEEATGRYETPAD